MKYLVTLGTWRWFAMAESAAEAIDQVVRLLVAEGAAFDPAKLRASLHDLDFIDSYSAPSQ
jgi:hypothetical protein